jgi:hypothetical protein
VTRVLAVFVIAHAGHWIESILVMIPTVSFVAWLGFITIRDRIRQRREGDGRGAA